MINPLRGLHWNLKSVKKNYVDTMIHRFRMYLNGVGKERAIWVKKRFLRCSTGGSGMIPAFIFCKNFEKYWFLVSQGHFLCFLKQKIFVFKIFFKHRDFFFWPHFWKFSKFYFFKIFFDMFFRVFSIIHFYSKVTFISYPLHVCEGGR